MLRKSQPDFQCYAKKIEAQANNAVELLLLKALFTNSNL